MNVKALKRKLSGTITIAIILIVIVGGYIFFLASPNILSPSASSLLLTETGTDIAIDTTHKVRIEDWIYSEEEHKMQIVLSFETTSTDASEQYVYQVVSRNKSKEKTVVGYDVTYQSTSFANLIINNVPKNFNEMALSVGYINKHKADENTQANYTTAYTNVLAVNKSDEIEPLNVVKMYIEKIDENIEGWNDEIEELNDEIEESKTAQEDILAVVAELQQNKKYMTLNEAENIDKQISSYEQSYQTYDNTIEEAEEKIEEVEDTITSAKAKKAEIEEILSDNS